MTRKEILDDIIKKHYVAFSDVLCRHCRAIIIKANRIEM